MRKTVKSITANITEVLIVRFLSSRTHSTSYPVISVLSHRLIISTISDCPTPSFSSSKIARSFFLRMFRTNSDRSLFFFFVSEVCFANLFNTFCYTVIHFFILYFYYGTLMVKLPFLQDSITFLAYMTLYTIQDLLSTPIASQKMIKYNIIKNRLIPMFCEQRGHTRDRHYPEEKTTCRKQQRQQRMVHATEIDQGGQAGYGRYRP